MYVRWVNSHFQAGRNLYRNWKLLVNFLSEFKNDRRMRALPKEKAVENLSFLLEKHCILTLVFQLDLQEIFKALSLEVQKGVTSFFGQSLKKGQLLAGLNRVQQDQGYYVHTILQELQCIGQNEGNLLRSVVTCLGAA